MFRLWVIVASLLVLLHDAGASQSAPTARVPATKFDMKKASSKRSDKRRSKSTSTSVAPASVGKKVSVKDSFFDKVEEHNKEAASLLMQLCSTKTGWEHVNTKDGVRVERRTLPAGSFVDASDAEKGSKHACVKSTGIVKVSPDAVFDLFVDNTRVSEYNEHCKEMRDVQLFPKKLGMNPTENSWTKISWASSPKYGPFKPRDFCSVVNFRRFRNGTSVIINRPAYHPKYPPSKKFVRATILLAGNVLEPYGPDGTQCKITQIAHVNPGGGADTAAMAWVINKLCAVGPPTFIRKLEAAAARTPLAARTKGSGPGGAWLEKIKVPKWFNEKLAAKKTPIIVAWGNAVDKFRKRS
jgi:hypothetical protein